MPLASLDEIRSRVGTETGQSSWLTVDQALIDAFAEHGLEFAYPTQTTFTAAPDGTMIMPYAQPPAQR